MNKNTLLFLGLAVAALIGLFYLLRPAPDATPRAVVAAQTPVAAVQAVGAELPAPRVIELVVRKGQRVSGPEVVQLHEGDDVELKITSDQTDELHVHGYDLHLSLKANEPAMLAFKAEHSGRFDYELHHAHTELGTFEVEPK